MCITNIRSLSVAQIACTSTFVLRLPTTDSCTLMIFHVYFDVCCWRCSVWTAHFVLVRVRFVNDWNFVSMNFVLMALLGFYDALQWKLCALCTCSACLHTFSIQTTRRNLFKVSEHVNRMPVFKKISNGNGYEAFEEERQI